MFYIVVVFNVFLSCLMSVEGMNTYLTKQYLPRRTAATPYMTPILNVCNCVCVCVFKGYYANKENGERNGSLNKN